jgi:tRNA nucleotidyltransferase (CCA-adding enzyme)
MRIILTHLNADFDAVASLLGAHRLDSEATPVLPARLNRNVREFLALYRNGLPLVDADDLGDWDIEEVLLVDTQRLPDHKGLSREVPLRILDHHPRQPETPTDDERIIIDEVGANATLFVERLQAADAKLTSLEATLLTLGIYEDTGALTYGTTTPRDIRAAAWLLEQQAVLDTVRQYLIPPLTPEQQSLYDQLLQNADTRTIQGYTTTVASAALDERQSEVAGVAIKLRETLDPAALFVVVYMPHYVQLIARSSEDAVDVGEIMGVFGGGGHSRAAAASLEDRTLETIVNQLWDILPQHIRPPITLASLMSYGVQTVNATDRIGDIISRLRRVGHEGYPVIEEGSIVGLLTVRDADRALEHGLKNAPVREIMNQGNYSLTPDDSVASLEQMIVQSGWGQIPIMNSQNGQVGQVGQVGQEHKLVGIVTRTDLIKHWARLHPVPAQQKAERVTLAQIDSVLGSAAAKLIEAVARQAHQDETSLDLYLVGGVVRDLLLERRNDDIDFVVERDAPAFANAIASTLGGEVATHALFGTAKWKPDERTAQALGTTLDALPDHIDFATARNEFYEHPTALPTVYTGSIKLDLGRRDFTINTLAVHLSPEANFGRILDYYRGLSDLRSGVIRVLHSLSFVDDPTRVLRAVRFAHRLGFTIEPRTDELITLSREMLRRITGERIRNELTLLMGEHDPMGAFEALQSRGVLEAIHSALHFTQQNADDFDQIRVLWKAWSPNPDLRVILTKHDLSEIYWNVWFCHLSSQDIDALVHRLLIGKADSLQASAALVQELRELAEPASRPSQIVRRLAAPPEIALITAWVALKDTFTRQRIERYLTEWQHVRPKTTGETLKARDLPPGPRYRVILEALRDARLDGTIQTDEEEEKLLEQLLKSSEDQR